METNYILEKAYTPNRYFPLYYFPLIYLSYSSYYGAIFIKTFVDTNVISDTYIKTNLVNTTNVDTNIRGKTYVFKEYMPRP